MITTYSPMLTAALMGQSHPDTADLVAVSATEAIAYLSLALPGIAEDRISKTNEDLIAGDKAGEIAKVFVNFLMEDTDGVSVSMRIAALMATITTLDRPKIVSYFREQGDESGYRGWDSRQLPMVAGCVASLARERLSLVANLVRQSLTREMAGAGVDAAVIPVAGGTKPNRSDRTGSDHSVQVGEKSSVFSTLHVRLEPEISTMGVALTGTLPG